MLGETELKVIAAVATAIATLVAAVVTGTISIFIKRRADASIEALKGEQAKALESIKSDLAIENKLKGARIDYEYEARKRLYKEVEPILFSTHLAATSLHGRLEGMIHRIREGHLRPNSRQSWMKDPYYQRSTVYRLFLPMAQYRLLSRKISQLDLTLEPLIGRKFMVLEIFQDILVAHFELAGIEGASIPYEPYADVADAERKVDPGRYNFQGLVRGEVEYLVSAMLANGTAASEALEWFRFDREIDRKGSDMSVAYLPVGDLLGNFSPQTHPLVWRALISFFLLSKFYMRAQKFDISEYDVIVDAVGWAHFDYRVTPNSTKIEDTAVRQHFDSARAYVRARIVSQYETLVSALPN